MHIGRGLTHHLTKPSPQITMKTASQRFSTGA